MTFDELSEREKKLIDLYRQASPVGREMIDMITRQEARANEVNRKRRGE